MSNAFKVKFKNVELIDVFGVKTSDFIYIDGDPVDAKNSDLIPDYFNPSVQCHPKLSMKLFIEFNVNGDVNHDGKAVYCSHNTALLYYCAEVICDLVDKNGNLVSAETIRFIPINLIPKEHFKECINDGRFYHTKYLKQMPNKPAVYRGADAIKKIKSTPDIKDQLKYGIKSSTYLVTEGKRYTFGAEIETSAGHLPGYLDQDLNYEAVHDGSLRDENGKVWGGEYVTGVLTGDSGFLQLKRLCNELSKRCQINKKCGVHIHIGGVNFNKEFIVYLYKLALDLEKEIYAMLPKSRNGNEYCRPLHKFTFDLNRKFNSPMDYNMHIDDKYSMLLNHIAHVERFDPSRMNKKTQHPLGNKCGYNHSTARYCWLNLVPAMFDTRGNGAYTIEIRNHSATLSYTKIKNWTLITMAMMWFAENEKQYIANNKVSLSTVIMKAYPKKGQALLNYIYERTAKFSLDSITEETNDYSEREINNQLTLTTI